MDFYLKKYILDFLNKCLVCKKYHIVDYCNICYRCKKILCDECSKDNMVYGSSDNESICKYCKNCWGEFFI